jgi:hypothetical protein
MHNPSEVHMEAALRVFRYLKSSIGRGILFLKNDHLNIIGYINADWAGNLTDKKIYFRILYFCWGKLGNLEK